jgi:hypothetical protein
VTQLLDFGSWCANDFTLPADVVCPSNGWWDRYRDGRVVRSTEPVLEALLVDDGAFDRAIERRMAEIAADIESETYSAAVADITFPVDTGGAELLARTLDPYSPAAGDPTMRAFDSAVARGAPRETVIFHWDRAADAAAHREILDTYDRNTAGQPVETKFAEYDRAEHAFASLREGPMPFDRRLYESDVPPAEPDLEDPSSLGARPARRRTGKRSRI